MSIIVSNCQHCEEQQFRTLTYTQPIFLVVKSNLFIRALLLDRILVTEKIRLRFAYILLKLLLVVTNLCKIQFFKNKFAYGFDSSTRYILSIIVYNCQHCDEEQFQTLSCVHYAMVSVVKLDLFIRSLLLDCILALEKLTRMPRVHLVTSYDTVPYIIYITECITYYTSIIIIMYVCVPILYHPQHKLFKYNLVKR